MDLILELFDAKFAAQVPIFDNLFVNSMFFEGISWIFMDFIGSVFTGFR